MRLHPGSPSTMRVCTKEYKFPNGLTLLPGDPIIIPIYALHRDPNIFPNPLCFNPDRFDEPTAPGTYLPFGDGPRICIGNILSNIYIDLKIINKIRESYMLQNNN